MSSTEMKLFVVVAACTAAFTITACTQEQSALNMPPGKYDKTVSTTDANGTTVQRKSSTEVDVDEYGNKKAVVQSKTTKDPKGLFNKTTTSESKQVIEER